jgi:threonine/homoserine/homoserine lactone efflux protein
MKGKLSFPERVGRSFRGDPFFSMWGIGALLILMTLLLLLGQFGGQSAVVFWLGAALGVAFLVWVSLVLKWSRTKFLRRSEQRRRRANQKASADQG